MRSFGLRQNRKEIKKMPKEDKSTDLEYQNRVAIITEMILSGLKRREIIRNVTENEKLNWNVGERQIEKYMHDATEEIQKEIEPDRKKLIAESRSRFDFIYKKTVNTKDYKTALLAEKSKNELIGLNAAIDVNVDLTKKITIKIE